MFREAKSVHKQTDRLVTKCASLPFRVQIDNARSMSLCSHWVPISTLTLTIITRCSYDMLTALLKRKRQRVTAYCLHMVSHTFFCLDYALSDRPWSLEFEFEVKSLPVDDE